MKKKILTIAFALFLVSFASVALALLETSSPFPQITIKFSKTSPFAIVLVNVSDLHVNLTDSGGLDHPVVINATPGSVSDRYQLTTERPLENGNYTLFVSASDIIGNTINTTQTITMDFAYIGINIINPPLSVSPKPVFDLKIGTAEPASSCKYSSVSFANYNTAAGFFDMENEYSFTKNNFNNNSPIFSLSDSQEKDIFVFCKDVQYNRSNPKTLTISYDTTRPQINASADPRIIVDRDYLGNVFATVKVNSDDKVVCRYSNLSFNETRNGELYYISTQSNFTEMTNYFGTAEDEDNESRYVKNPSTNIDLTGLVNPNPTTVTHFAINVACINRATFGLKTYGPERVSAADVADVTVNLLSPISITKNSPPDYQSNGTIFLNFSTNKLSACTYNFNSSGYEELGTTDRKVHTKSLEGDFPEGSYSLSVSCTAEAAGKTQPYTIVIDKTPPSTPIITSPNATCAKQLSATFNATDNQSGIASYNYTIIGPGIAADRKLTSSGSVTESGLNLSNFSTYYFTAIATNRAGLSSGEGSGNPTTYDETGVLCDARPPSVFLKQNTTPTGVFVTFICLDSETECKNDSYMYFLSQDQSCNGVFQPITYDNERQTFGAMVPADGYFCYEAEDLAGNKAKGYEKVAFQSSSNCYNQVQDDGETDVDCGGESSCERCGNSKKCLVDADCVSRYCFGGICEDASCTDQVRNGFEADVDCGGYLCQKCALGKSCTANSDCESGYCDGILLVCALPACDDSIQNGNETDVDCGGGCERCSAGKSCRENSDCITQNCFGGKCVQQPLSANETAAPVPGGEILFKILKIVFLMIGILGVFGGSGYLYYKKSLPKKPVPPAAGKLGKLAPEAKPETKPRELTAAEKIKRLTIHEQLRREREEREEKRESLFGRFGAPGKITPKIQPKPAAKPGVRLQLPVIRRIIKPELPKPPARKPEEPFERLGGLEKKKEDIFERLARLRGETEFEKLEKIGRGKKAEDIEKLKRKKATK